MSIYKCTLFSVKISLILLVALAKLHAKLVFYYPYLPAVCLYTETKSADGKSARMSESEVLSIFWNLDSYFGVLSFKIFQSTASGLMNNILNFSSSKSWHRCLWFQSMYSLWSGLLAFFGACVVLLVVAVIVWKPRDSIIYPMKRWKPRYRSLGVPPPVPSYIRYDVDHWPDKLSYVDFKIDVQQNSPKAVWPEPSWVLL